MPSVFYDRGLIEGLVEHQRELNRLMAEATDRMMVRAYEHSGLSRPTVSLNEMSLIQHTIKDGKFTLRARSE